MMTFPGTLYWLTPWESSVHRSSICCLRRPWGTAVLTLSLSGLRRGPHSALLDTGGDGHGPGFACGRFFSPRWRPLRRTIKSRVPRHVAMFDPSWPSRTPSVWCRCGKQLEYGVPLAWRPPRPPKLVREINKYHSSRRIVFFGRNLGPQNIKYGTNPLKVHLKPISPKSTYLPTPNLGNFLVIWGKFLVNFKIRIFYIIFRVFYN